MNKKWLLTVVCCTCLLWELTGCSQKNSDNPYPLSEPGSFGVGYTTINTNDPKREDRAIGITIWYPTKITSGTDPLSPIENADPNFRKAPYPLILSSTKVAEIFAPFLVSHGFTWASVNKIDYYGIINKMMIDQPLDILFVLNFVSEHPQPGFEGLIDTTKVGVTGYSFDGYNTYAVSGARIDEAYYRAQCPEPDEITKSILGHGLTVFGCSVILEWDNFTLHAQNFISSGEDGLWQAMTDERIQAVVPMAGEGWWLFGERGLAAIDRPVLILVGTEDDLYPENALIYEYIGTSEKALIAFKDQEHMMVVDPVMIARMSHFLVAFFGYHLQGHEDYAQYYSEEFVNQHEELVWGTSQDY